MKNAGALVTDDRLNVKGRGLCGSMQIDSPAAGGQKDPRVEPGAQI